jgi:hypothetical protein
MSARWLLAASFAAALACSSVPRLPPGQPPSPQSISVANPGGDAHDPHRAVLSQLLTSAWAGQTDKDSQLVVPLPNAEKWKRVRFFGFQHFVGFRYGDDHHAVSVALLLDLPKDASPSSAACIGVFEAWARPQAKGYEVELGPISEQQATWRNQAVVVRSLDGAVSFAFSRKRFSAAWAAYPAYPGTCLIVAFAVPWGDHRTEARLVRERWATEAPIILASRLARRVVPSARLLRVRYSNLLVAAALAGALLPLPLGLDRAQAEVRAQSRNIMPVDQLRPGMKGHGLTVFSGTRPERFDVEIIGVLENFQPRQELILIKTTHPRLEVAKVVAGMSGSPIYINDKMIGAYAYGWTFGREPVAGVTPIASMLDDLARPLPDAINGWPLRPMPKTKPEKRALLEHERESRFAGRPERYNPMEHARQLEERLGSLSRHAALRPVATPILLGGMSREALALTSDLLSPLGLEPLAAGGGGKLDKEAPERFEDGGAIGVNLVSGDMSAMGLGTVTRVEGDRLVAFGHPMMQAGVTALPTSVARVLWFLASEQRSFKIGSAVRPLGALVNDRLASIVVDQSKAAPTIPVRVKLSGAPGAPFPSWSFTVAHEKFLTPSFLAVAIGNAFQATAAERQDVSWTARSVVKVKGYGEIRVDDFGVAIGGTPVPGEIMGTTLVRAVGGILNNPWEPAFVEAVSTDIELSYAREIYSLRGATLLTQEVNAGEDARIALTLVPFSGREVVRTVSVPIPKHLAEGTLTLTIAPGHEVDKDLPAPETLGEFIRNLSVPIYPPKSVVVSFEKDSSGVAYRRHVANNLPVGALDRLQPTSTSIRPSRHQPFERRLIPLNYYMVGNDTVTLKVKAAPR